MIEITHAPKKWILIVSSLFALLSVMVTMTLIFSPESALANVDLTARGVGYLIQMWAARQFALACIFVLGVIKKSTAILIAAYTFFLVMNIGDLAIGVLQSDSSLISGASVVIVIASLMLYALKRK